MNFCCIFPGLKNVDLIKHVGLTPYYLAINHGYKSTIVSFNNDEYTNLEKVKDIKLELINRKFKINILNNLLIILYLLKNAKNIDVLNCYHYSTFTIIYFIVFKIFNRNGIAYFTFDTTYKIVKLLTCTEKKFKCIFRTKKLIFIFKYFIDLANIETKKTYYLFTKFHYIYKKKLMYMPVFIDCNPSIDEKKKNQIISVGRIGSYYKASEVVLEAFKKVVLELDNEDWILKMVGPISNDFEEYIGQFFNKNPQLKKRIIFTGNIENKDELYKIYSESKIFCLPSRSESFGIVFAEALFYDNYILATDVGIVKYLINLSNFGEIVEKDNIDDISKKMIKAMKNFDKNRENNKLNLKKLIHDEFSNENYIQELNCRLKELKK